MFSRTEASARSCTGEALAPTLLASALPQMRSSSLALPTSYDLDSCLKRLPQNRKGGQSRRIGQRNQSRKLKKLRAKS